MRVLKQSARFNQLPSQILRIREEYLAFCFDEACEYIMAELEEKKRPVFKEDLLDPNTGARKTFLSEALRKEGVK